MLLDPRLIGFNATLESRNAWAEDQWPQIRLMWAFLMFLHFAALIQLDPFVVHVISLILNWVASREMNDSVRNFSTQF